MTLRRGFYRLLPGERQEAQRHGGGHLHRSAARLNDGREQPYLVTVPYGNGKVVYLGSGETVAAAAVPRGLPRALLDQAGPLRRLGQPDRLNRARQHLHGQAVHSQPLRPAGGPAVRRDMQPLPMTERPGAEIKPPSGVPDADQGTASAQAQLRSGLERLVHGAVPGDVPRQLRAAGADPRNRRTS